MDTTDQEKLKEYRKRRLRTYKGSFRHFLATLAINKLDEEKFYINPYLRGPFGPIRRNMKALDLKVEPAVGLPGYFELSFNSSMRVDYEDTVSWIKLNSARLIFDRSGNTSEYGLLKNGHWASERMADILPLDYVPKESDH
jgi:hypothetical protein